ncbi:chorismate mutase [Roseibium sp.]|uniref:chorismate mutase n=1 Tax=Roseibium sp. TaxID=1936156 RepID=UPI003A986F7A
MSSRPDTESARAELRLQLDALDAKLHDCLIERSRIVDDLSQIDAGTGYSLQPGDDADLMRHLVEHHQGTLPLHAVEHIWRMLIAAGLGADRTVNIHLDGSADLLGMLDVARFHFGFSCELIAGSDAADVVGAIADGEGDLGLIALEDRADLPWWRGLSLDGAEITARLPFLVNDERPADLPAFVIAQASAIAVKAGRDTIVYDARWSGALPGSLMTQGLEVVSFHRSMSGVDALLAVSADLSEDQILAACEEAGAVPDVLRMVGGYSSPIDVEGDADDDFGAAAAEG